MGDEVVPLWEYPPQQDVHPLGNHDSMEVSDTTHSTSSMSPVAMRDSSSAELMGDLPQLVEHRVSDPATFPGLGTTHNIYNAVPTRIPIGHQNGVSSGFLPISSPDSASSTPFSPEMDQTAYQSAHQQ